MSSNNELNGPELVQTAVPASNLTDNGATSSEPASDPESSPRRRRSIRLRLAALVLACVLPVWAVAGFLVHYSYQSKRALVDRHMLETARALALLVDRDLDNMQSSLTVLATSPSLAPGSLGAFYSQAQTVLAQYPQSDIILADATGQQFINSYRPFGTPLPKRNVPEAVRRVYETGKPAITNLFRGAVTGRYLIGVDVPVIREGRVAFDLAMTVPAETMARVFAEQQLPPEWNAAIVDSNGIVVARTRHPEVFVGTAATAPMREKASASAEGTAEIRNLEGTMMSNTFSRAHRSGWTVIVGIPRAVLLADIGRWLTWTIAGVLLLSIAGIALALSIARGIAGSIQSLVAPALALGRGEPVSLGRLDLQETHEVGESLVKAWHLVRERAVEHARAEAARREATELQRLNVALEKGRAEARARAAEMAAMLDSVPAITFIAHDRECRVITGSRAAYELLRRPFGSNVSVSAPEEERPRNFRAIKDGRELAPDELPVQVAAAGGREVRHFEFALRFDDGSVRDLVGNAVPLFDDAGQSRGAIGAFVDITDRKQAADAIERRNALLQGINTVFQEALAADSEEQLGRTCLRVAEQITGSKFGFIGEIDAEEMLSSVAISDPGWDACAMLDTSGQKRAPSKSKIQGLYGRVIREGKSLFTNEPYQHPDSAGTPAGHAKLTAFLGVPLIEGGRTVGIIAVANREGGYRQVDVDSLEALAPAVTEAFRRMRAEQALRSNEARLRLALEAANSGTWEWDLATGRHQWSEEVWKLYGLEPRSCEPSHANWLNIIHPEDRPTVSERVEEAARTGAELNLEYRVPENNDDVRWLMTRGSPLYGYSSTPGSAPGIAPLSYLGIVMDITERKRSEQALIRSEKLASAGRMAATVAHEINNPLEAIGNSVYLAWTDESLSPKAKDNLDIAVRELERVAHLTRRTLGFYRERTTSAPVDLRVTMDSVIDMFSSRLKSRGIALEKRYADIGEVQAAEGEIRQIISNLLSNSLDAMADGGRIGIRIGTCHLPAAQPDSTDQAQTRYVSLTIADTGCGIAPERMSKIFEPFFTTKENVGTGLGLWVTKELVQKHQGKLRLRSRVGQGTVFRIFLPKCHNVPEV